MVPVTDSWCDLSLGGKKEPWKHLLTHWSCELERLGVMYVVSCFCVHTGIVNLKGWVSCMLYFVRTPGLRKASSAGRGLNRVHVFISRTVIKPTTCVPVSLHFPNAAHFRIWGVWLGICTQLLKSQRVTVQWGLQIQQLLTVLETYIMADTCTYSHTHTHIWHTCILARRCMNAHAHTEKAKLRVCSIGTLTIS